MDGEGEGVFQWSFAYTAQARRIIFSLSNANPLRPDIVGTDLYSVNVDDTQSRQISPPNDGPVPSKIVRFEVSPNSNRVAFISRPADAPSRSELFIVGTNGAAPAIKLSVNFSLLVGGISTLYLKFNELGSSVFFLQEINSNNVLQVTPAKGGQATPLQNLEVEVVTQSIRINPNGNRVVYTLRPDPPIGTGRIFSVSTTGGLPIFLGDTIENFSIKLIDNGTSVLFVGINSLNSVPIQGGEIQPVIDGRTSSIPIALQSPDMRTLVYTKYIRNPLNPKQS